jgi:hypothetical protein
MAPVIIMEVDTADSIESEHLTKGDTLVFLPRTQIEPVAQKSLPPVKEEQKKAYAGSLVLGMSLAGIGGGGFALHRKQLHKKPNATAL